MRRAHWCVIYARNVSFECVCVAYGIKSVLAFITREGSRYKNYCTHTLTLTHTCSRTQHLVALHAPRRFISHANQLSRLLAEPDSEPRWDPQTAPRQGTSRSSATAQLQIQIQLSHRYRYRCRNRYRYSIICLCGSAVCITFWAIRIWNSTQHSRAATHRQSCHLYCCQPPEIRHGNARQLAHLFCIHNLHFHKPSMKCGSCAAWCCTKKWKKKTDTRLTENHCKYLVLHSIDMTTMWGSSWKRDLTHNIYRRMPRDNHMRYAKQKRFTMIMMMMMSLFAACPLPTWRTRQSV